MHNAQSDESREEDVKALLGLIREFKSSKKERSTPAYRQLATIDRTKLLVLLDEILASDDDNSKCDAALVLLTFEARESLSKVLLLLEDDQEFVRYFICGLIHDLGDMRATEPLMRLATNDRSIGVRMMACYALGGVGSADAIPVLQWIEENDNGVIEDGRRVAEDAHEAIEAIEFRLARTDQPSSLNY